MEPNQSIPMKQNDETKQVPAILQAFMRTCGDLTWKGWAERNAGNVSVRLTSAEADSFGTGWQDAGCQDWIPLPHPIPELSGETFLVTGTGRYLRNVPVAPAENCGLLQLDDAGENYRLAWGFENGAKPTSELSAHLSAHAIRKHVSGNRDRVVLHTHPTNLIALCFTTEFDSRSLTRLLWEMHAECIFVFPEGIGYLPWMMAGSEPIAEATARMFADRSMVVWEYHGVFASGADLDDAFGLIDTAEKAAGIYLAACQAGGVVRKPSDRMLAAIAANFGKTPVSGVLEAE
jgi:rhamnulose-1-phosphate aldolase